VAANQGKEIPAAYLDLSDPGFDWKLIAIGAQGGPDLQWFWINS
jgi:hypothetical protein